MKCLNFSSKCKGQVKPYIRESDFKAFSRCEFHQSEHRKAVENSVAKYANSQVPPSWFDPAFAGEQWDED